MRSARRDETTHHALASSPEQMENYRADSLARKRPADEVARRAVLAGMGAFMTGRFWDINGGRYFR